VAQSTERIRVLIVDDIVETRENLRKLLSFDPDIDVAGVAATGEEGIELARETRPHVVLMDINLPGMDGITATKRIAQEVPTAQIVILSVQGESGYMRRAMAAGARDFLVKPPSSDELVSTIHSVYEIGKSQAALISRAPEAAEVPSGARKAVRRGRLVTVFAPKGGVGCTTVAVNLAIALHRQVEPEKKVAVLDANLQFGDVGVMLNLQANRSIADLADRTGELDSDMLTSVVTPHPSGIKVLLPPPSPAAAESLWMSETGKEGSRTSNQNLQVIVDGMLQEFDFLIADTWSWVDDVTLTLLDRATLILLVITPVIPAIKSARLFMDLAYKLGYPEGRIGLVINHADRRTGLRVDQIEGALKPAIAQIPFDERAGLSAANRGLPLVSEERGKPLVQGFTNMAQITLERIEELTAEEDTEEEWDSAETSRRLLGRIMG
jgi:pilus assembly protein CpaE